MNTIETRRYEMLVRVQQFGEAHRERFPESTAGAQAFATVAAAVTGLSGHAVSTMSTAREGTRVKRMAREALGERLETIGRTARALAEGTPGFDDPFRLPQRQSDETLLMAGRMFVEDAEASRSQFIGHGLPETFVADLTALVETFEQAIRSREAGRSVRAVAQATIAGLLLSGLAAVRQLDVIVANQLAGDRAALAGWERDRRVHYPHRAKIVIAAPAPAPQPLSIPPAPLAAPAPMVTEPKQPAATAINLGMAS